MGEHDVDEIIAQWRASARAAGESEGDWSATEGARRWLPPRGVAVVLAGLLGTVAVAALLLTGRDQVAVPGAPDAAVAAPSAAAADPLAEAAAASPGPLLDDWFAVMSQVDRVRRGAYSSADGAGLAEAFAPSGQALQRELDLLNGMRDRGVTAPGWNTRLIGVSPLQVDEAQAELRVTDERAAYDLVGTDGILTPVPAAPPTTWLVTLQQTGGSWLVERVKPELREPATSRPAQP